MSRLLRLRSRKYVSLVILISFFATMILVAINWTFDPVYTSLVIPDGIPLVVKDARYPEVIGEDISAILSSSLQQDVMNRFQPHEQAMPLKLLSLSRRQPRCQALINGDKSEQSYALQYMDEVAKPAISPTRYIEATQDCDAFVKSRGYIHYATQEEKDFPIAYSIMMYKDVEQVERLLRSIYRPHNFYCIHVDAKSSNDIQKAMRAIADCLPNVFMASKMNVVEWSKFNSLTPFLTCMNDLWKYSWKYFINLTGQEFPLKTNLQLVKILKALQGSNVVDATRYSHYSWRWYETLPAPHNIQPIKGLVFVVVSRGFVDFTIHSQEAKDLLHWVNYTNHPDETFFPTINHNPHLNVPGSYNGEPDSDAIKKPYIGRFVNWGKGWKDQHGRLPYAWQCGGKRVRGVCVFGVRDLPLLINRKELFANKFHLDFEPYALECIESWHFNMTMLEYAGKISLETGWYSNLSIVKNKVV